MVCEHHPIQQRASTTYSLQGCPRYQSMWGRTWRKTTSEWAELLRIIGLIHSTHEGVLFMKTHLHRFHKDSSIIYVFFSVIYLVYMGTILRTNLKQFFHRYWWVHCENCVTDTSSLNSVLWKVYLITHTCVNMCALSLSLSTSLIPPPPPPFLHWG